MRGTTLALSPPESRPASDRLTRLVADHLTAVWRTLRRLGLSAGEADDAAQQILLLASRKLEVIAVGSERAFLMGAALRIAAGFRRKRDRRREVVDSDLIARLARGQLNPEDLLEQRRARELLDELLGELPTELATVLVLYEFEQLSMLEIAGILELKPGTVASRLRRARSELSRKILRLRTPSARRGGAK